MRIGKLKVTPILETGITIDFEPKKNPVDKPCHLHLRWTVEKCPNCGSALMMYYSPTVRHESGIGAALPEQMHGIVLSCVHCGIISERFTPSSQ